MASFKVRRQMLGTGGGRFGGASNYSNVDTAGRLTMVGTARTYKEIWVPATQFGVYSSSAASAVGSASGNVALTNKPGTIGASAFSGSQAACILIPVLVARGASDAVGASMVYATAVVPKPLDADTTGCINVRLVWTVVDPPPLDPKNTFCFKAAMGYISAGSYLQRGASCGTTASYFDTVASSFYEVSLGNLPSWGAADLAGVLQVGVDGTVAASNTAGSAWAILGAKLRYVANSLGTVTT